MNVLWLMFDSLRKDTFLHTRHSALDHILEKGCVFDNARSQSGFTLVSCSSMWTGKFPHHCSVNLLDPTLPSQERWAGKVKVPTTRLQDSVVFDKFAESLLVFESGTTPWQFDAYVSGSIPMNLDSTETLNVVLQRFRSMRWQDTIAFVRLFDTHLPYNRFQSPLAKRREGEEGLSSFMVGRRRCAETVTAHGEEALLDIQKAAFESALNAFVVPMLDALDSMGVLDRTLVIICSDHGDRYSVNEKHVGHARFYDREIVEVPIVFMGPDVRARTSTTPVGLVDIAPTVLDLLGKSMGPLDGRSLSREICGGSIEEEHSRRLFFHNTSVGHLAVLDDVHMLAKGMLETEWEWLRNWQTTTPDGTQEYFRAEWERAALPFMARLNSDYYSINTTWPWAGLEDWENQRREKRAER